MATPHPRQLPARFRSMAAARDRDREEQIRSDEEFAWQLQEQDVLDESIRLANERHASSRPSVPPVAPPGNGSDEEIIQDAFAGPPRARNRNGASYSRRSATAPATAPVGPGQPVLDRNGAFTPEPYQARPRNRNGASYFRHFPRSATAPATPATAPAVPGQPVLDQNGAFTPEPYQARPRNRNGASYFRHFPRSATAPAAPSTAPAIPSTVPATPATAPVVSGQPVLDRNGAFPPESHSHHLPRSSTAPVTAPVVTGPPVLDQNGAYIPEPHQSRSTARQSASVIPPVVPSAPTGDANTARAPRPPRQSQVHQSNGSVIPPTTRARNRTVTFAPESSRPPQPPQPPQHHQTTAPFIPPAPDSFRPPQPPQHHQTTAPFIPPAPVFAGSRRAATPVPPRPTYWYPPGFVPPHMRAQTPVPMMQPMYYPPPGAVIPAPPIPPIYRPQKPNVVSSPPPQKTEEVIVPFIPPEPDEKPSPKARPRPILKPKPTVKPASKAVVSSENDDTRGRSRTKTRPTEPKPKAESPESTVIGEADTDVDLQSGPLHDLRKHVRMLTGSLKCTTCAAEVHPTPIHKDLSTLPRLPSFDSHLHLTCSACSTMYCRGCLRTPHCKRTCNAGPDEKCFLRTCCRAGRAIAIFAILSCFDAKFLAMFRASRRSTYLEYIKKSLSSSSSPLSELILETVSSLLAWLPIDPIHSKSQPHVHDTVKPLFQVSLLLEVIRMCLRVPREAWIRPGNGKVYKTILMFLVRLEEVGKGALAGLVLERQKDSERTKGVGRVVWALAERVSEKNKGNEKRKELGWTAGGERESFCKILSEEKLGQDLQDMKDKIREEEKKALLDHLQCQLLRWTMAETLK